MKSAKTYNQIGYWYRLVSEIQYRLIGYSVKSHIGASLIYISTYSVG